MPIPQVNVAISDGALGIIAAATDLDALHVGACSAGTVNTVYGFNNIDDLRATLGHGPLVEAMALALSEPDHGVVYGMRLTGSVAGANGAVTRTGSGVDPGATLSGTPLDDYQGIVKIVTGGARGTATFVLSLDNGDTWTPEILTAATYAVANTGLTINFAVGTYVAADTYTWTSTAPYYGTSDFNTGMTAALADPREWGLLHVVGVPSNAANTATMFSAVDAVMTNAETAYRFSWALMQAADDSDSNLLASLLSLASSGGKTSVAAGFAEVVSPVTGRIHKRAASWIVAARAGATPISRDLADVGAGPLNFVKSLYRDENGTPGLDAGRFITLRTIVGLPGFYITNPRTMATLTSDFQFAQYRRVICRLAKVMRTAALRYLSSSLRTNDNGTILEEDAVGIDADIGGQAIAAIVQPGHGSAITVQTNRTDNILSTQTLRVSGRCRPLGYAKTINLTIGFTNPALVAAAAA